MNRQNHSEPENRLTPEEKQEFLELLARLSPEQREALKEVLKVPLLQMSACWEIDWSRFSSMMCLNAAKTEALPFRFRLIYIFLM